MNILAKKFKQQGIPICLSDGDEGPVSDESVEASGAAPSPKSAVVALANNEHLVIDTNASFWTAKKVASNSSCDGAILCLDVEVVSDGTYSQFSQIGAVLSTGGETSYFEAKVGKSKSKGFC
jgi:hypothetical protein